MNENLMEINILGEGATIRNVVNEYKPNEDYFICDNEHQIYIVADGVTLPKSEYSNDKTSSPASILTVIFAETLHKYLISQSAVIADWKIKLKDGVQVANEAVMRAFSNPYEYQPGAVFTAVVIRNQTLYCAFVGDVIGFVLRDNTRLQFTERQTFVVENIESNPEFIDKFTRRYRYDYVLNNKSHPVGYGTITGDKRVFDFISILALSLISGDVIIIASDGIQKYLMSTWNQKLQLMTPQEIIDDSEVPVNLSCGITYEYDKPPFNSYGDDKTILKINVKYL